MQSIEKIISGGQTGVDQAALDTAISAGIDHGGWCPRGRLSENGPIPDRYLLHETDEPDYAIRTERNILDSDATLVLFEGSLKGGTALTWKLARHHGKPCLKIDLDARLPGVAEEAFVDWVAANSIQSLNVAGPRESQSPGIGKRAAAFLKSCLRQSQDRK